MPDREVGALRQTLYFMSVRGKGMFVRGEKSFQECSNVPLEQEVLAFRV